MGVLTSCELVFCGPHFRNHDLRKESVNKLLIGYLTICIVLKIRFFHGA